MKFIWVIMAGLILGAGDAFAVDNRRPAVASDRPVAGAGLQVSVFARGVGVASAMAVHGQTGDVLTADSDRGRVLRLRDRNRDGLSEIKSTFLSGFDRPSGLTISDGQLFISDARGVWRAPLGSGLTARAPAVLLADLTKVKTAVMPRPLAGSADAQSLYLGLGALSDRSEDPAPAASIIKIDIKTGRAALFAGGLKQTMAMDVTASGRLMTMVSDSAPAPDFFTVVDSGGFYGWPYAYGAQIPAPGMARKDPYKVAAMRAPLVSFDSAKIGTGFLLADALLAADLPESFNGKSLIVMRAPDAGVYAYNLGGAALGGAKGGAKGEFAPVLSGFANARGQAWGQPSALAIDAAGGVLVADRFSETIWRVVTAPPIVEAEDASEPDSPGAKDAEDEPVTAETDSEAETKSEPEPETGDDGPRRFRVRGEPG